jgi:hypothetical protein
MIPKSGNRFPACAKPSQSRVLSFEASAGEARLDKIIRKQNLWDGKLIQLNRMSL